MKRFLSFSALAFTLAACLPLQAQYAQLHQLTISPTNEGRDVVAGLVQGKDGNFYGVAKAGGYNYGGSFFRVTATGAFTVLHDFNDGSVTPDAVQPSSAPVFGADGNFYGTTMGGGASSGGTIYKMSPAGVETILHSFDNALRLSDGIFPHGSLLLAKDGNFYGTTYGGGPQDAPGAKGTVFKITPAGALTTIHCFGYGASLGAFPEAALIQGRDGLFYGTTSRGGTADFGCAFSITSSGVVKILHSFGDGKVAHDGRNPQGALFQAADGNFYGTTTNGGSTAVSTSSALDGEGTVFKMTPAGAVTILHHFGTPTNQTGSQPYSGVIQAADGNLYGTTYLGGASSFAGSLYRISTSGTYTILHSFYDASIPNGDGYYPMGPLIQATDGSLYGTTTAGGTATAGTIYKYALPKVVTAAPVISGATKANAAVGKAFSFQITATNSPDKYTAAPLPAGVKLNATTGLISGTPTAGGTFTVALTAKNAKGTAKRTLTITVAQGAQTITFPAVADQVVGGKINLGAKASSGLAITYKLISGPATLSGKLLTFTGAGAVTVQATQPGNTAWKAAKAVNTSIVVKKKAQTITFDTIPTKVLGVAPFKLTGKSSSGLTLTYSVTGNATLIGGDTIKITGTGNIKVVASQAGNATFLPAANVTQKFVVTAK